ncbi:hypothetical protein PAPYR_6044 [Paratrimastix pyriformis]|uniref:Uncharacterized protein n=1 Tax=Paratrimastix pyriformis TaxID=342808 RepID=A0ABQ8UG29_9EUKA|nr:hypothetical protein PAPYR_6044 [Paratrimastix pyriformis]
MICYPSYAMPSGAANTRSPATTTAAINIGGTSPTWVETSHPLSLALCPRLALHANITPSGYCHPPPSDGPATPVQLAHPHDDGAHGFTITPGDSNWEVPERRPPYAGVRATNCRRDDITPSHCAHHPAGGASTPGYEPPTALLHSGHGPVPGSPSPATCASRRRGEYTQATIQCAAWGRGDPEPARGEQENGHWLGLLPRGGYDRVVVVVVRWL